MLWQSSRVLSLVEEGGGGLVVLGCGASVLSGILFVLVCDDVVGDASLGLSSVR